MNVSVGHCPITNIIITLIAIMMTLCLWKIVKYRGSVGQCPGLVLDQSLRVSFMLLSIFICCNVSIASSSSQSMTIWSRFLEFIYTEIKCRLSLWSQVPEEFDLLLVQLHQRYRCLFFGLIIKWDLPPFWIAQKIFLSLFSPDYKLKSSLVVLHRGFPKAETRRTALVSWLIRHPATRNK